MTTEIIAICSGFHPVSRCQEIGAILSSQLRFTSKIRDLLKTDVTRLRRCCRLKRHAYKAVMKPKENHLSYRGQEQSPAEETDLFPSVFPAASSMRVMQAKYHRHAPVSERAGSPASGSIEQDRDTSPDDPSVIIVKRSDRSALRRQSRY